MRRTTANATLKAGNLHIYNRKLFDEMLKSISDGKCLVTVERVYNKRSNQQNRYYHGVVIPLCCRGLRELGHEVNEEDTHEILKSLFNKKEFINKETGESTMYGGSTTKMATIDMMEYIKDIQEFGDSYLGIFIPDPEPIEMKQK